MLRPILAAMTGVLRRCVPSDVADQQAKVAELRALLPGLQLPSTIATSCVVTSNAAPPLHGDKQNDGWQTNAYFELGPGQFRAGGMGNLAFPALDLVIEIKHGRVLLLNLKNLHAPELKHANFQNVRQQCNGQHRQCTPPTPPTPPCALTRCAHP